MSLMEDEDDVFSVEKLLTLDEGQLVEYMKRRACAEGGFDISSASGLDTLSRRQRDKLYRNFMAAAQQVESADDSGSVDISTLLKRLADLAGSSDGILEDVHLGRPRAESQSSARTSSSDSEDLELICYNELLENGGRPVVPYQILSREPRGTFEKDLPWLDGPMIGMPMVFLRQADRWWEFRKWQLDNRGPAFEDDGVSAYLAAQKRRQLLWGSHDMVSNSVSFEMVVRGEWEMRPKLLEVPRNAGFPAYKRAVQKRLASHKFNRKFELEDDPRQQGLWTIWVEYLNFEYWQADRLAASLKTSEKRYRQAWSDLQRLDTPQPSSLGRVARSTSKGNPTNAPCLEQQLATTQAELQALRQKIDSFIRELRVCRRKEEDVHRQTVLTRWVLEQLLAIEAETAQQRTAVKNDQGKALPSKKRRQTEDNEVEAEKIQAEHSSKRLR